MDPWPFPFSFFYFEFILFQGINKFSAKTTKTYKKINQLSKKYILIAEYFSPNPVKINYRGYKNKLFKRDFAKEYLKINKKSKLLDYGFVYEKDKFPQDNINWFLIKKWSNIVKNVYTQILNPI